MDLNILRLVWLIGIMVGVYCLVRLCALMELPKPVVRVMAAFGAIITLLAMIFIVSFNSQMR
ncbi:MAG: hypothetical protein FJ167_08515 [Gammaproteobacteria bacterium]|nr:hypothetical protein [Acidimicrobiia bacterium]MBM4224819.1 hypothetical protein [Gammaproteobacteria bacterium]